MRAAPVAGALAFTIVVLCGGGSVGVSSAAAPYSTNVTNVHIVCHTYVQCRARAAACVVYFCLAAAPL